MAVEPAAHGAFHWAPIHHDGLNARMKVIAEWVTTVRPAAVVVDVSVEVASFIRLLGVPVVVMAMPGSRWDAPHDLVYRLADHIVAPWPQHLYAPPWLRGYEDKTTFVGGISRFDGRAQRRAPCRQRPRLLVLSGAGGTSVDGAMFRECAAMHPQYRWTSLGLPGGPWVTDPWPALCSADVVVSAAGQSSVAEIASAERPAIVIPEPRPFGEQQATVEALRRGGLAVTEPRWPSVEDWPSLVDRALAIDPKAWRQWNTRGAAERASDAIQRVADTSLSAGACR